MMPSVGVVDVEILLTMRLAKCENLADRFAFVSWDSPCRRVEKRKYTDTLPLPSPPPHTHTHTPSTPPPPNLTPLSGCACLFPFHSCRMKIYPELGEILHLQPFTCAWVNSHCAVAPTFQTVACCLRVGKGWR